MTSPTRFRSRMSSAVKFDLTPLTRPPRQTIFLTRVPNKRFLLKNQEDNKCLKAQDGKVVGANCSSPDLDMLWRWTGTKDKQLMNIRTLQCMQGSPRDGSVSLEKCQENSKFQKMTFISLSKGNQSQMTIGWARWGTRDRQVVSHRFLQLNSTNCAVAALGGSQIWKSTADAGCYRFSDGSFMKYVNYSEMSLEVQISAPTLPENHVCEVEQNFQFIRDGEEWQTSHEGNIFSVDYKPDSSTKELKIAKREHYEAWNGTLLKLFVKCGNNEPHCVLLKLQSLPGYNTKTPRVTLHQTTSPKMTTISSKMTTIAIAVPVSLLAVILVVTLIYFVCYRRLKRAQNLSNDEDQNQPPTLVPLNAVQPSTQSAQREPQQYEVACERQYEYVDKTAITLSQTFTYDYASVDATLKYDREPRVALVVTGDYANERPDTEDRDTHHDYRNKKPDTEDRDMHDDYVVCDVSYISVIS